MQFTILKVRTFFRNLPIRSIHSDFFHGKAKRGGRFATADDARVAYEVDRPLCLHKNVYNIADLFCPEFELVVSERIASQLNGVAGISLMPVKFEVLYRRCYQPGKLRLGWFWNFNDEQRYLDRQVDHPELHAALPRYFHLQIPPVYEITERHPTDHSLVSVEIDGETFDDIPVSPQILQETPAYSLGAVMVLRADLFEILRPSVDPLYFHQVPCELP